MRTGYSQLPLHGGRVPRWLFKRMTRLAREIICHLVAEYGAEGALKRLADPFWFQAFGCVLGFDWHSSGITTTACGAVKEGIKEWYCLFNIVLCYNQSIDRLQQERLKTE